MAPTAKTVVATEDALKYLRTKIDRIVVLMMEGRSFDHVLGFLTIDAHRADVAGRSAVATSVRDPAQP